MKISDYENNKLFENGDISDKNTDDTIKEVPKVTNRNLIRTFLTEKSLIKTKGEKKTDISRPHQESFGVFPQFLSDFKYIT